MGQFMSVKSELLVCAEKYVSSFAAGDVEINRQNLLRCLQTNNFRDVVAAAEDKSKLAIVFVQAGERGHADVLQAFLDNGINVDVEDDSGCTALMRASGSGRKECVRLLFDHNSNVDVQNDINGSTALIYACVSNEVKIVKTLLEKNADVNIQNNRGWTALMYASCYGYKEIVRLLLSCNDVDTDLKSKDGKTAFDWTKDEEVKELLLNHVNNSSYVLK